MTDERLAELDERFNRNCQYGERGLTVYDQREVLAALVEARALLRTPCACCGETHTFITQEPKP